MTVPSDTDSIKQTLLAYSKALTTSNAQACADLYAQDGIIMPQHFPAQSGYKAILEWYTNCSGVISLDVEFTIEEVVVVSDEYAFASTTSSGTQKMNETGKASKEANTELFVMKKVAGQWQIARYCFCTSNPPN